MPYLILLLTIFTWNTSYALSVSPNPGLVQVGQTLTLTATDVKGNISWSTIRGGKILGIANTVTYLAPDTIGKDVVTVLDDTFQPVTVTVVIEPKKPAQLSLENAQWEVFTNRDNIHALLLSDNQEFLWVGTGGGLEQRNAHTGELVKLYTNVNGLPDNIVNTLLSDGHVP